MYKLISISQSVENVSKNVQIRGWIVKIRSSGKITFLEIRDGSGTMQIVCLSERLKDKYNRSKSITLESSCIVYGIIEKTDKTVYGVELLADDFEIISLCQNYPLGNKAHGVEFLFENRHLSIRNAKESALLKIRSNLGLACRLFLHEQGFYEFVSPIITPSACEGTTTLFEVDYFGLSAYLSQSGQLYSEAGIFALEKVYCFGPVFRAEKSKTRRHLTEFWCVEPEAAWMTAEENMKLQERFIHYIISFILERNEKELLILNRKPDDILCACKPFPIILYDEAVSLLQKKGMSIKWGDDLGSDEEAIVSKTFDSPFFIYKYPVECRAFYIEPDKSRPEVALSSDCLMPDGFGEIITGGQRASDYDYLLKQIEKHKLVKKDFEWYLDLRRYGSVPHSGFGMGIERMLRWICNVNHIRETIPFPRTISRFWP